MPPGHPTGRRGGDDRGAGRSRRQPSQDDHSRPKPLYRQGRSTDDRAVTLTVTTDPAQIVALLDRLLAADPVRATVLGSIVAEVRAGRAPEAWCAVRLGTDALVA